MLKRFVILLLCLSTAWMLHAQPEPTEKPVKFKFRKVLKQGNNQLKDGNIYAAAETYEEILKNRAGEMKVMWNLATVYEAARDYKNAKKWYQQVYEKDPEAYPMAQFKYAQMLKMTGEYIDAKDLFLKFSKGFKGEDYVTRRRWAKDEAEGCDLAIASIEDPAQVNMTHLNEKVNHPYSDISPVMWDENTMIYATLATDTVPVYEGGETITHLIKMYSSQWDGSDFAEATTFPQFDIEGMHVANGAFSTDKKRFYFTACKEESVNKIICAIYMSTQGEDDSWGQPEDLGPEINTSDYTTTQPAIGPYKNDREILYFASNRPGGRGGMDIWYSIISSSGKHASPRNCGGKLNTDRDEATPFYDNKSGNMYFSSTGHPGMGGYDVFSSTGQASRWTEPENVGYPLNSETDDMYFRLSSGTNGGFVVSNRPGVFALKSETCCDDIFRFETYKTLLIAVDGLVFDEAAPSVPLTGSKVSLHLSNYKGLGDILVSEVTLGQEPFFFELNADADYKLTANMDGYLTSSVSFDTKGITESDTLHQDLVLKKLEKNKTYSLRNIYYDYDKATLRDESKPTLDSLYQILMENPGIVIELGAHTDARGSEAYNQSLSQKRAESVVKYLIGKGIDAKRLQAKGYGESQPLEDCKDVEGCSMESGIEDCPCHQKNRRTEFKITGEIDIEVDYEDERYEDEEEGPVNNTKGRKR